jgi:phosphatidylglycerophosphate synthase
MKETKNKKPAASNASGRARPNARSAFGGKILFFIIICGILLIAVPLIIQAQIITIPNPLGEKTIPEIIAAVMTLLAGIGSGVAVIMIIWGGIQYMTSGGSEQRLASAKKTITWAIIGTAILWSGKFIVDLIEYILKTNP